MSFSARLFTTNTLQQPIKKTAHGFTVGKVLRFDGVNYVLAQANAIGTSVVVGMVAAVVDADNFILTQAGYVTGVPGGVGLIAGTVYYLSPTIAGNITSTLPVTIGQFVVQLFYADTTTSGYFMSNEPVVVAPGVSTINVTTVDFGATPVSEANFTIVDAQCTITSLIILGISGIPAGGKDQDELEMDSFYMEASPAAGTFNLYVRGLEGYLADAFNINYMIR